MGYKVVVAGATGNVGREMLNILAEREFPADEVVALASRRSIGTEVSYGDKTLPIKAVRQDNRNFTLYFADGYVIGLGAVTATGMTWVSGASGDQFNCKRVN